MGIGWWKECQTKEGTAKGGRARKDRGRVLARLFDTITTSNMDGVGEMMQRGWRWTGTGDKAFTMSLTPYGIKQQMHCQNEHPNCPSRCCSKVQWCGYSSCCCMSVFWSLAMGGVTYQVPRPFFVLQGHIQTVLEGGEVLNVVIKKSRWEVSTQMALKSRDWIKKLTSYNIKCRIEE